jgi:hypothetical protein
MYTLYCIISVIILIISILHIKYPKDDTVRFVIYAIVAFSILIAGSVINVELNVIKREIRNIKKNIKAETVENVYKTKWRK